MKNLKLFHTCWLNARLCKHSNAIGEIALHTQNRNFQSYSYQQIIFNEITENPKCVSNFLLLAARFHMFRSRCHEVKPCLQVYKKEIHVFRNIERYNVCNSRIDNNLSKWYNVNTSPDDDAVITDQYINDYLNGMAL